MLHFHQYTVDEALADTHKIRRSARLLAAPPRRGPLSSPCGAQLAGLGHGPHNGHPGLWLAGQAAMLSATPRAVIRAQRTAQSPSVPPRLALARAVRPRPADGRAELAERAP